MGKAMEVIQALDELARGKIKIAVDENISGVATLLRNKGYKVLVPKAGTPDDKIHEWLNDENVKAFFTKNGHHFKEFFNRTYVLYWLDLSRPKHILADLIECVMMKDFRDKGKAGATLRILNNPEIKRIGCKM